MKAKLTKRKVESLKPTDKRYIVHDTELPGFQLRVEPSGRLTYLVYYRTKSRQERRYTLGQHGHITTEQARCLAQDALSDVRAGKDPSEDRRLARTSASVEELCNRYMDEHAAVDLKPSTQKQYRWLIEKCIVPHIGKLRVIDITRSDIERLRRLLSVTPRNANQAVSLLSTIFNRQEALRLLPPSANPCASIRPFKTKRLERFLSGSEIDALAKTLDKFEREGRATAHAIAAVRLLITTGCRKNEICRLRWDEVDFERRELRLSDSKTGAKRVPLNTSAVDILSEIPRLPDNEYVIVGHEPGAPLIGLQHIWERIRAAAGLNDVRIHDLRHTFASVAISSGIPLALVGRLLGHATPQATSRYAHLADEPVREASERVGNAVTRKKNAA